MTLLAPVDSRSPREPVVARAGASTREQTRVRWISELGLLALLYAGYLTARAVMGVQVSAAQQRGQQLLDFEALGQLDVERPLNALITAVPALGLTFAYLYATLHYLVTPAVLLWVAVRRRAGYREARNAILAATAIGLIGYWLLPTAPPRLLDAGFTDTMAAFSGVGWWGQAASAPRGMEALSNQYAALPSLHVGWAVWVALCLRRHSNRRLVRRWVWIYPALMTVVVMATANHYLVDALAGAACARLGYWLAGRFPAERDRSSGPRQRVGGRPEMAYVGAAAAAEDREVRNGAVQLGVLRRKLFRVAGVQRLRLVQLGVGLARGVRPYPAQPVGPRSAWVQHVGELGRVSAVDREVGRRSTGDVVDALDGLAQAGTVRQHTIGFDRERDRDRDLGLVRSEHDTDSLVRVGHRHGVDHVRIGPREGLDLFGVVVAGLLRIHPRGAVIAVAAWSDAPAHDDVVLGLQRRPRIDKALDREAVRVGQSGATVTEQVSPVRIGSPGGGFDDETGARIGGHLCVLEEVTIQARPSRLVTQQRHCREVGQVHAVVKDQRGLEAGVGEEHRVTHLR
jgi:hypothetical protein